MIACTLCGTPMPYEGDASFVRCGACNTTLFGMGGALVPCYRLRPSVLLGEASALMRRWLADNAGPAGLDGVAVLAEPRAYDLLFWSFQVITPEGYDQQVLVPAVHTPLRELRRLELPTGSMTVGASPVEVAENPQAPTVLREHAYRQAGGSGPLDKVKGYLVRLPLYEFPYSYNGHPFRIMVEGVTGLCLVDRFPHRSTFGYRAIFAAALAAFALEGWVLWGEGTWLALTYLFTAIPAGVITYYLVRSSRAADRR